MKAKLENGESKKSAVALSMRLRDTSSMMLTLQLARVQSDSPNFPTDPIVRCTAKLH